MFNTVSQSSGNDKNSKDLGEIDINIDEILNDLKKDILRVYKNTID
jgi:hypothetical protein